MKMKITKGYELKNVILIRIKLQIHVGKAITADANVHLSTANINLVNVRIKR